MRFEYVKMMLRLKGEIFIRLHSAGCFYGLGEAVNVWV